MSGNKNIDISPSGTWWYFQIKSSFFDDSSIRRLQHKHGDTGIVIFIQLCAESLKDGEAGYIERKRTDMGETFAEELAFNIDRDETLFRDVFKTLMNLQLIIPEVEETLIYIPMVGENNKRLTPSARSNRKTRAQEKREKERTSQSEELDSHSGDNNNNSKQQELELEKNNSNSCSLNNSNDCLLFTNDDCEKALESAHAYGGAADAAPDAALSISALIELSKEIDVGLSQKGAETYHKITKGGLELYGKPIEVPAKALRGWAKRNREKHPEWFTSADGGNDPGKDAGSADSNTCSAASEKIKALEPLPEWDYSSTTYRGELSEEVKEKYVQWIEKNIDDNVPSEKFDKLWDLKGAAYATAYFAKEFDEKQGGLFDLFKLRVLNEDCYLDSYPELYKYFAEKYPYKQGIYGDDFADILLELICGEGVKVDTDEYIRIEDAFRGVILEMSSCPDEFKKSRIFTYEFVHNWLAEHIDEIVTKTKKGIGKIKKSQKYEAPLTENKPIYNSFGELVE